MDPLAQRVLDLHPELRRIVYRKFHEVGAQSCREFIAQLPSYTTHNIKWNFIVIERRTPRCTAFFMYHLLDTGSTTVLTRLGVDSGRRVWKHVKKFADGHDTREIAKFVTTKRTCHIRVVARVRGMMREHVGQYSSACSASMNALVRVLERMEYKWRTQTFN